MEHLYISDLDGTLLNEHAELSHETAQHLNCLIEKGLNFTVATARTYATVEHILREVKWKLPMILMNGVMLYDPLSRECMEAETIKADDYHHIIEVMKENNVTGFVYGLSGGKMTTYYERLATPQMEQFYEERVQKYKKPFVPVKDLAELADITDIIYLSLLHTKEVLAPVYDALKDVKTLHMSFYKDIYAADLWYLEISNANATKYHAVEKLRRLTGAKKITCFGDNLNDLPLFQASDETCAVANAHKDVKDAADHVIGSNLEDGVVAYLEGIIHDTYQCPHLRWEEGDTMDYRRYPVLMERYKELGTLSIDKQETKESLIKKLTDISYEKKQILVEANAIIREYIIRFEKEPDLLDGEAAAMLEDFLLQLSPSNEDFLDTPISLRICRLLLRYYQSSQDAEQIIQILKQCAYYDLTLKEHQDDYESTPYALMAEPYMDQLDKLSDKAIRTLVYILTLGGYNRKDRTFGLRKYRENKETFAYIRQKVGEDDFVIQYYYTLFKSNALGYALVACLLMEDAKNRGSVLSEPLIDLEQYAPLIEEFKQEVEKILGSEQAQRLLPDRVTIKFYIAQTDYHLGRITLDELLTRMEEYLQPHEDHTPYEQGSALLTGWPCYLDYLCRCGNFDPQYVQNRSMQVIEHVLANAEGAVKELSQYFSTYFTNRAVLQMISTASGFLEFDFFKRTVLNVTVYANKELYVHTMMVKEICLILLTYILDHNPQYLDGVAGYGWEYCREHKQEILELMENCALLHDIGKYFCLDIVNNSSRSLTDDEFEIIKEHPTNFSKIYQGSMNPQVQCIRDCAELHHLWYDESGGYPQRAHTINKPFVNILTIADCIDAATDNIGRPYGFGKTLEQVMAEFDDAKDTRYSGYISELLHVEEIQRKIDCVINDRRKDIYCRIYLRNS